jgi:LacI family transcriptional regulator
MELLQRRKVPIVGNGNWYPFSVWLDYPGLVAEATRRLLSEGCRKIAFMEWGPPGSDARQGSALFHAFTRELALHGATLNPHWVRSDLHPASEGAGWAEFREIWAAESVKPDGLIVADDMLCLGAVEAIRELGIRVPAQLRVVSHGNKGSGVRYPFPVSVLECDPAEYAQAMVKLMVAQLRQEPVECPQVLLPFKWAEQDVGNGIQVGRIVPMSRVNEGAQ